MSDGHKGIQWGGLIKGLVATAAVVGGVALVFPGLLPKVIESAKEIFSAISTNIGSAAAAGTEAVKNVAANPEATSEIGKSIGWVATKLGGVILAVSGLKYLTRDKTPDVSDDEKESFTAREDMRRMQALMLARMQAQGYQPAMAGQGRG